MTPASTAHPGNDMNRAGPRPSPVLVAWSGGKDCTLALREALTDPALHVTGLVTTITEQYDRISMHGVRRTLLHTQAGALELPLIEVPIPPACPNDVYERCMAAALARQVEERRITGVVFGDLYLQDVREYRERQMADSGLDALFPLWHSDTHRLARTFIDDGFRAILCTVDPAQVAPSLVGRDYDASLLADLPGHADPCGENGEFHTFVWDGPLFRRTIPLERGEAVERDGFWFQDLVPAPT